MDLEVLKYWDRDKSQRCGCGCGCGRCVHTKCSTVQLILPVSVSIWENGQV